MQLVNRQIHRTLEPKILTYNLSPCSLSMNVGAGGFARLAGFNGGRHLFELCLLQEQDDNR